jgi:ribosomal protein S18 acetylase RimI-like enzyme
MAPPGMHVVRAPPLPPPWRGEWRLRDDKHIVGAVKSLVRPDNRCFIFFDSCRADAYQPLLAAVAESVDCDLYLCVDEADSGQLALYLPLGLAVSRREGTYRVPTSPDVTGLGEAGLPAGLAVISAEDADEDRLRLLDDALRQDVPGADGWRWDAAGFHEETFSPAFDPATYLVAVAQASGEYAGLLRVWNNPEGPLLGLIAALPGYRRRGLARALIAQAFAVLRERGKTEVTAEIDDANVASISLFTALGARRTGGSVELIRRRIQQRR